MRRINFDCIWLARCGEMKKKSISRLFLTMAKPSNKQTEDGIAAGIHGSTGTHLS